MLSYRFDCPVFHLSLCYPFCRSVLGQQSRSSKRSRHKARALEYPVIIAPLAEEDGGGFSAGVPDLPGCMSDGDTPEEAITNVQDAITVWLEAARDMGREIPAPSRRVIPA
ncbi:type II toxin-antitoxin system HicB family antitoxin [Mesorhizobium sp. IMUNJ 23232]|uniref:type II toxin-antitoxin system HicB family antitoxin n=1 Tax=Mesorhizobium sp. IMUNJ 23232 TaxID=3376064 RepID=UPI0037A0C934